MRVCWVSDNPRFRFVGQSRVSRNFCSRLKKDYELSVIGFNEPASQDARAGISVDYPVHVVPRRDDGIDVNQFTSILLSLRPDVVILSHDVFLFSSLPQLKTQLPKTKFIGYFTIDGDPFPPSWLKVLDVCDIVLSPTDYGKRVIEESPYVGRVGVVPYGVDLKLPPGSNRIEVKKQITTLSLQQGSAFLDYAGNFVVLFYGQNQTKKNLYAMRDGWGIFVEDKRDVRLLLLAHSRVYQHMGWTLLGDSDPNDFNDICSLTFVDAILPDENLIKLLAGADCLLFPSIGEGFALPVIESMSCGVVPIVTNYAGVTDYVTSENSFLLNKWVPLVHMWGVVRAIADPIEIAEALNKAYSAWKSGEIEKMRINAQDTAARYTWDKGYQILKNYLNDPPKKLRYKVL